MILMIFLNHPFLIVIILTIFYESKVNSFLIIDRAKFT